MTCASCVEVIENESKTIPGIITSKVNFATENLYLETDDNFIYDLLQEKLESIGYKLIDPNNLTNKNVGFSLELKKAIIALLIGSAFMIFGMGPLAKWFHPTFLIISQSVISFLVILFLGRPFFNSVIIFLKTGKSNMNTLIGIGVFTSFFYSILKVYQEWNLGHHIHVYFESVPFIIGFTLLGKYFDSKAKTKARSGLSSLYKMQLKFASKVIKLDPVEVNSTPVKDLVLNDLIRILPGEKIPLEGEVIRGSSHTDEALVSGESKAMVKNIGDQVIAGSINLDGTLIIKVKSILKTSLVSSIIDYIEKAQSKKLEIERIVDRIVRYFTPTILIVAFLTFLYWNFFESSVHSFDFAIAVLLVACPCALGLAVPMAVMLSTSEALKIGLFISGGDIFEKVQNIDTIIFDKTGTLTKGQAEVVSIESRFMDQSLSFSEPDLMIWINSLVEYSSHPLSKAIYQHLKNKQIGTIDPDSFKSVPGGGIEGFIKGRSIKIGSKKFVSDLTDEMTFQDNIGSHVYVSVDQKILLRFTISDQLKPEALEVIQSLKKHYKVVMLSGDNFKTAEHMAKELGIEEFFAEVVPSGKSEFVEKLKHQGRNPAMVGDGVNDAMALSAAHLSISMGNGSDIAIEASDITITDGNLHSLTKFFSIAKKSMNIIYSNLLLSFLYNVLAIPIAAGFFYKNYQLSLDPILASVLMGLSSLSVVLNSLRLKGEINESDFKK